MNNCNAIETAAPAVALPSASQFSAAWVAAFAKIQAMWQQHVQRAEQARAMAIFAQIDQHTLRDIGAPYWIVAEAAQREAQRERALADLNRS